MKLINTIPQMQAESDAQRAVGKTLALVPTMGALHQGHLSLVELAKKSADHVTVSIYVNPTQFGPGEDFDKYPRPVTKDLALLDELGGVDVVFLPTNQAMYPRGQAAQKVWVQAEGLDQHLCGAYRDGHFQGVTTVVAKLFNACKPHLGIFGLKDAQQFLILRRMVEDLNMGISLLGGHIYREEDGLAASSRNVYLSASHRAEAPHIYKALQLVEQAVKSGERHAGKLRDLFKDHLQKHTSGVLQYVEIVETENIQPVRFLEPGKEALVATAVFFGETRLIDNIFLKV